MTGGGHARLSAPVEEARDTGERRRSPPWSMQASAMAVPRVVTAAEEGAARGLADGGDGAGGSQPGEAKPTACMDGGGGCGRRQELVGDGLGSQSSEFAATAAELDAERGVAGLLGDGGSRPVVAYHAQ